MQVVVTVPGTVPEDPVVFSFDINEIFPLPGTFSAGSVQIELSLVDTLRIRITIPSISTSIDVIRSDITNNKYFNVRIEAPFPVDIITWTGSAIQGCPICAEGQVGEWRLCLGKQCDLRLVT